MDDDMDAAARIILGVEERSGVAVGAGFAKARELGDASRWGRAGCINRDGG